MKKLLVGLVLLGATVTIGLTLYLGTKVPMNERLWDASFSKLNTIDFDEDGSLTIHNLRDFTYASGTIATSQWRDVRFNPEDIERVYFFVDHFSPIRAVGHTFISFHLKNGTAVAFSIEARREATEKYSFVGGFLRQYELQYLWGYERDLITQRVVYKDEQLYRFPLVVAPEQAAELIREFARETNTLAATPRFYHTLTANCTNMLAKIINQYHPDTLPYDISWNLTGLADGYLEKTGFIATEGLTQKQLRARYDLTAHKGEITAHASDPTPAFSAFIGTLP